MKKYLIFTVAIMGFAMIANAQTITKRVVERTYKGGSKSHYNYLLLDAVNYSDDAYSNYESLVQSVWDKKSEADLTKGRIEAINVIDVYLNTVKDTPIYKGGKEYQMAVVTYINAVKDKVIALEHLGILGNDANTAASDYDNASAKFMDISSEATNLRNKLKEKKYEYERTFYIE